MKLRHFHRKPYRTLHSWLVAILYWLTKRWPSLRIVLEIVLIVSMITILEVRLPNFLSLDSLTDATTLLSSITQVLASVLGIIVAVLVVAFEISRRVYTTYASYSIFENRALLDLLLLQATTVVVAVYSQTRLSDPISEAQKALCHAIFYLFVLGIIMLFPTCRDVLSGLDSRRHISRIIESVDPYEYHQPYRRFGMRLIPSPESAVLLLTRTAFNLISAHDRAAAQFLFSSSLEKVDSLLVHAEDKRLIINSFLPLLTRTARSAIELKDEDTLKDIISVMFGIHARLAREQAPWHHAVELNEALEDIIFNSMLGGLEEASSEGLYAVAEIAKHHLRLNVPKENEIWFLDEDPPTDREIDYAKSNHWREVSTRFPSIIGRIGTKAIELGRSHTLFSAFHALCLMLENYHLELPSKQRRDVVLTVFRVARQLRARAMRQGMSGEVLSPFSYVYLDRMLERNERYAPQVLLQLAALVLEAAETDAFDRRLIEEIGAIGRSAARRLGSRLERETLLFVGYIFARLRRVLENKKMEDTAHIYSEVYSQLDSVYKWLKEHHGDERKLARSLQRELRKFQKLEPTRVLLSSMELEWPQLKDDPRSL